MKIYLIRHAEQQEETQCLTARGYRQAAKLGEGLKGKGISVVFSSDRSRARETARVAATAIGAAHEVLDGLEEVGEVQVAETTAEAEERAYRGITAALADRPDDEVLAFVLHSNLIRHFLAKIGYKQYLPDEFELAHTGIVVLDYDAAGKRFELLRYNLASHLDQ
jgi:broad specificity phosphatase PhoE